MVFQFIKDKIPKGGRRLNVSRFFSVAQEDYMATGERDAILASSGMGKSYLTGVIAEETIENGGLLCVIDPEGEYWTMVERYPMLIVGGERAMVPLCEEAIDLYIQAMLETNLSVIFDLSELLDHEQQEYYAQITESLFQQETVTRKKVRVIVEEAQIFAPQRMAMSGAKGGKKRWDPVYASQKIAKRGRKRAIDSLWATQRPASLNKDILSQCNRFWFGGIMAEQDYKAIKPFLTEAGISFSQVKELHPGEFYFYSKGMTKLVKVRKRHCKHAGATPEAEQQIQPVTNVGMQRAIEALVEQIEMRNEEKRQEESEINQLMMQIKELQKQNNALRDELGQEKLATKVIKRIEVRETPATSRNGTSNSSPSRRPAGASIPPPKIPTPALIEEEDDPFEDMFS